MGDSEFIGPDWERLVAHAPAGERLTFGVPEGIWSAPWSEALRGHSEVDLCVESVSNLGVALGSGALSCALVPVEMAVRVERGRVIPGLGICVDGAGAGPWVGGSDVEDGGWGHGLARVMDGDASGFRPFGCAAFDGEAHDLAGAWAELTGLPWVAAVWVAVLGAPIPRLRQILGTASREELGPERMAEIFPDVSVEWIGNQLEGNVYYTVGSREMESIREFLKRGAECGLTPEGGRVTLC